MSACPADLVIAARVARDLSCDDGRVNGYIAESGLPSSPVNLVYLRRFADQRLCLLH
jgi:hypothetical protein